MIEEFDPEAEYQILWTRLGMALTKYNVNLTRMQWTQLQICLREALDMEE